MRRGLDYLRGVRYGIDLALRHVSEEPAVPVAKAPVARCKAAEQINMEPPMWRRCVKPRGHKPPCKMVVDKA